MNVMMTRLSLLLAVVAMVGIAFTNPVKSVVVDTQESVINWKGYKVLGNHYGTVQLKSGELKFEDNLLVGGAFSIDMTTIVSNDLTGEYKTKLENHLKSADFFGVENHPEAKFVITKVTPNGVNRYKVEGDLTIKTTTKAIKFIASVTEDGDNLVAEADIQIDRSEYDVRYGSGSFFGNLGDNTIYDEFDLQVKLVTSK